MKYSLRRGLSLIEISWLVFIALCGYGGYWAGKQFGILWAVIGAILGTVAGYLILIAPLTYEWLTGKDKEPPNQNQPKA